MDWLIWFRTGISSGVLWTQQITFRICEVQGTSWLAEGLLASQGEFFSMALANWLKWNIYCLNLWGLFISSEQLTQASTTVPRWGVSFSSCLESFSLRHRINTNLYPSKTVGEAAEPSRCSVILTILRKSLCWYFRHSERSSEFSSCSRHSTLI